MGEGTALGRVRGLGSAQHGSHHWLLQRFTAAGNLLTVGYLAFALLFLPAYVGVKLFARAVGGKARRSILGPIDRLLGGGFGMVKGLAGATLFFLLANLATDMIYGGEADRPDWMTESRTYPLLNATARAVVDWVETRRTEGDEA